MQYTEKEHLIKVPVNYENPKGSQTDVFSREVFQPKNKNADVIVYFQGGPGHQCPRSPDDFEWMKTILKSYRLVLIDQRGTGRSQIIGPETATKFRSDAALAEYLSHFRADNIVRDTEMLREKCLKKNKIIVLGQSFGGFVVTTYLSRAPESLKGAMITGGVPPMLCESVDEVYQNLMQRLIDRNKAFYKQYPKDKKTVRRIIDILQKKPIAVDGGVYSDERFLDAGWCLGSEGGLEMLHKFLENPFTDSSQKQVSWHFAKMMSQNMCYWETNPIYAFLHEASYCNGFASKWSADRVKKQMGGFSVNQTTPYFSGEAVRKNMFKQYPELKPFAKAANILAKKKWDTLYDHDKLANNTVPVEILLMQEDFYVDLDLALPAFKAINNAKLWLHKTWQHDAIRKHGEKVITTLLNRLNKRI